MPLGIALLLAGSGQAQVVDPGPYQSICGAETFMQAVLGPGESGTWSVQIGSGTFVDPNDPTTLVQNIGAGVNFFEWTVTDSSGTNSGVVTIVAYDPGGCLADAGSDSFITETSTSLAGSSYSAPCNCAWLGDPNVVFVDDADPNTIVTGLLPGSNILTWSCYNGPCSTGGIPLSDQVIIYVDLNTSTALASVWEQPPAVRYDPINDLLIVDSSMDRSHLRVVDAMGRAVFSQAIQGPRTWDLSQLPSGTYLAAWYTADSAGFLRFMLGR
jgi:hypothetical protein